VTGIGIEGGGGLEGVEGFGIGALGDGFSWHG
jgi:hypothetical protein